MNASALAEKLYGKGRNISNFVYVGVTNGIGSGSLQTTPFMGEMGFSGEIGHISINYEGPKCDCGNTGCLELYSSIPEIVKQAKISLEQGINSALKEYDFVQWGDIVRCAMEKDMLALNIIDRLCMYISIGIVSMINLFDPSVIFLGHDIAIAGRIVTEKMESYIKERTISRKYKEVPVQISAFKDKAPIVGSAALVLNQLFLGDGFEEGH